jgi:hypothetical protein
MARINWPFIQPAAAASFAGALYTTAFEIWLSLGRRRLSRVDCWSFGVLRNENMEKVFGFDQHFREHGFDVLNAHPSR